MIPPKPAAALRPGTVLGLARAFRHDLLSALPAKLYRAWMAEFRSPLIRSALCNDPALVRLVLQERPQDFPKSDRLREGLAPLLGRSVFVTNGAEWARQRRIIDPAFEGDACAKRWVPSGQRPSPPRNGWPPSQVARSTSSPKPATPRPT